MSEAECELCGDLTFTLEEGQKKPCVCLTRRRARVYLRKLHPMSPVPSLVPELDTADPDQNLLIKVPYDLQPLQVKWLFAYLLLKRGIRRTYEILNATETTLIKFGEHEKYSTLPRVNQEVLCVYYGFNEIKNAMLGEIMVSLLEIREVRGLTSWVVMRGLPTFASTVEEYTQSRGYEVLDLAGSAAASITTSTGEIRESKLK